MQRVVKAVLNISYQQENKQGRVSRTRELG